MKKKLAIVIGSDIRSYGGGEKYIIELCKRLRNYDITIYLPKKDKDLRLNENEIRNIVKAKLKYFKAFSFPISQDNIPFTLSGLLALSNLSKYDVIYIADPSIFILFIIPLILRLKKHIRK